MATYVIGDIHGCLRTLLALLERIDYRPGRDRLWLVGDLVNRGPDSLGVLRWAMEQGPELIAVIGNHDLALFSALDGLRALRPTDTTAPILAAPELPQIRRWLRSRPLLYNEGPYLLVHAALHPSWSLEEARALARDAAAALFGARRESVIGALYEKRFPELWDPSTNGPGRHAFVASCLTRMRMLDKAGRPRWGFTGAPEEAPAGLLPWYAGMHASLRETRVIFGHWAALGLRLEAGAVGLDTGCVYGGRLSALRLEDHRVFQQPSLELPGA